MADRVKKQEPAVVVGEPAKAPETVDPTPAEVVEADAGLPQEPKEVVKEKDPLEGVPDDLRGYVTGFWHDKPNYQCEQHRGFKTVDAATFRLHLDKVHIYNWLEGVE